MPIPERFVQIDEEGYALTNDIRITSLTAGQEILENLKIHEGGTLLSTFGEVPVIIEAFDEPYIAQQILKSSKRWSLLLPYDTEFHFDLQSLTLDEWDRFHGYAENGVPFVMSRKAQVMFFDALDEFDDESITSDGVRIEVPPYWPARPDLEKEKYWTQVYIEEKNPGWNLGAPAEALKDMIPRLKLTKSRILVLGCGEGHDAARFAQDGHVVTAVDISPEALRRARALYDRPNLQFVEADVFQLPREWDGSFDVVFEHTCFCAVNPQRRQELVKVWTRLLTEQGQLMGVFFTYEKRQGPPYGGTEWELRQRLKNSFHPIFWGRWQKSLPRRQGKELFIFMQKTSKSL